MCFFMAVPNLLPLFVRRFESLGVPYMVTGSVAMIVYGEPRLTLDVGIVAALAIAPRGGSPVPKSNRGQPP